MPTVAVRCAESQADRETCLRLRWTVFVEEQGVPPSLEKDAHDAAAETFHALALVEGVPAGTGRLIAAGPGVAKVQRMAVIDDARGQGVGRALLRFLEDEAQRRGARSCTLDAQLTARAFYEKEGFAADGESFFDAGIQHVKMGKKFG